MTREMIPYLMIGFFSVFVSSVSQTMLKKASMKEHKSYFFGKVTDERHRKMLTDLLSCGFDCILTTNYSYELENCRA